MWRKTVKRALHLVFGWRHGCRSIEECGHVSRVDEGTFERALLTAVAVAVSQPVWKKHCPSIRQLRKNVGPGCRQGIADFCALGACLGCAGFSRVPG